MRQICPTVQVGGVNAEKDELAFYSHKIDEFARRHFLESDLSDAGEASGFYLMAHARLDI